MVLIALLMMFYCPSVVCLILPTMDFALSQDSPTTITIPGIFILDTIENKNVFGKLTCILAFVAILPYFIMGCIGTFIAYVLWLLYKIGEK